MNKSHLIRSDTIKDSSIYLGMKDYENLQGVTTKQRGLAGSNHRLYCVASGTLTFKAVVILGAMQRVPNRRN